jgi:hypothetical protein
MPAYSSATDVRTRVVSGEIAMLSTPSRPQIYLHI